MLKEILSIAGKPGLYKLINSSNNAIIVESLLDGHRFPAYSNAKVISLEDISIYTEDEDMPLKQILKRMAEKYERKQILSHKADKAEIVAFMEEAVPEYDRSRVYISDMKKLIQWYNILANNDLLVFEDDEEAVSEEA